MKILHKILLLSSIFLLSCSSPTLENRVSEVNAEPAMWLVTHKQSKVYLLGSVHILPPQVKWYGPRIQKAFERSDVTFCWSLQDEMTDENYMAFSTKYGLLPDSGLISKYLTSKEYKNIRRACRGIRVRIEYTADRMKPWLFFLTLDAVLNESASHYGVDRL